MDQFEDFTKILPADTRTDTTAVIITRHLEICMVCSIVHIRLSVAFMDFLGLHIEYEDKRVNFPRYIFFMYF